MLRLLHLLILFLYLTLPAALIAVVLLRRKRGDAARTSARIGNIAVTFIAAFAVAVSLCLIYGRAVGGHVPLRQILMATYFAAGMLLLLRGLDAALLYVLRRLLRLRDRGEPTAARGARVFLLYMMRTVLLIGIGLPYVMAVVMIYRPKVMPLDNPRSQLGFKFERVEFTAVDGTRLVGWWMPGQTPRAARPRDGRIAAQPAPIATETVILCHGLGSSKSNQLILGRRLVPAGYNVLAFDFRAHGESGGQVTGFGALEKRDVLAAVRWVREAYPDQSQKVFGVGASMGAVALIAAAADPSSEGQAISAIASYAAYDDLDRLVRDISNEYFERPLGWLVEHIGLPVGSAHAGVNFSDFAPARDVQLVWPRPILFIHGRQDEIIPFLRGERLFDSASHPKYYLWYPKGSHNDIVTDEAAAAIVVEFFRTAIAVPVI